MLIKGCNCTVAVRTQYREMSIPYSNETLREAVSLLEENASIEGDGTCKAIRKSAGVTGCVITPLTIGTAPLLLYLAMGAVGKPVFVSETRDLYRCSLDLLPAEDCECFDLIQDRSMNSEPGAMSNVGVRRLFEGCRVQGFELRIMRGENVKLRLDVFGERSPAIYAYKERTPRESGEWFNGDNVSYKINGKDYSNIYGLTISTKKQGGTRTGVWIKRAVRQGEDIPGIIDDVVITAQLLQDRYELRHFGTFRITIKKLVLVSDETEINATDTVIGPLRYYVAGTVSTEVFTSGEEVIS